MPCIKKTAIDRPVRLEFQWKNTSLNAAQRLQHPFRGRPPMAQHQGISRGGSCTSERIAAIHRSTNRTDLRKICSITLFAFRSRSKRQQAGARRRLKQRCLHCGRAPELNGGRGHEHIVASRDSRQVGYFGCNWDTLAKAMVNGLAPLHGNLDRKCFGLKGYMCWLWAGMLGWKRNSQHTPKWWNTSGASSEQKILRALQVWKILLQSNCGSSHHSTVETRDLEANIYVQCLPGPSLWSTMCYMEWSIPSNVRVMAG